MLCRGEEAELYVLTCVRLFLQAFMAGEPIARQIDSVDLTVRLSSDYHNMTLDVSGVAHERDPASDQCTMLSANPIRHLRDAPRKPIKRAPNQPAILMASDQSSSVSFKLGDEVSGQTPYCQPMLA